MSNLEAGSLVQLAHGEIVEVARLMPQHNVGFMKCFLDTNGNLRDILME